MPLTCDNSEFPSLVEGIGNTGGIPLTMESRGLKSINGPVDDTSGGNTGVGLPLIIDGEGLRPASGPVREIGGGRDVGRALLIIERSGGKLIIPLVGDGRDSAVGRPLRIESKGLRLMSDPPAVIEPPCAVPGVCPPRSESKEPTLTGSAADGASVGRGVVSKGLVAWTLPSKESNELRFTSGWFDGVGNANI